MPKQPMRLLLSIIVFLAFPPVYAQQYYMLAGTYNSPQGGGIYVYKFNSDSGTVNPVSVFKTSNPSYITVSPDNKYVYAVGENASPQGTGGQVSSFVFNKKSGMLSLINVQSSSGNNPCYIATDKKGKWVIAGNYSSGSIGVLAAKKGRLSSLQTLQHEGNGPDTSRQKGPHVHGVFPQKNSPYVFITDLGTDKVYAYYQNNKTGKLSLATSKTITMPPGSGPRHLDFHPSGKFMYVLNELSNGVSVLKDTATSDFFEIQTTAVLPLTFKGKSTAADIHVSPDGRFLYTSNRGTSNTIAIFSIDQQTGMLTLVDHQYTEGETPRNFNFDPTGNYLIVGNQNSNTIVIFKRNKETGLLSDTGQRIVVAKPVCIKWIPVK